MIYPQNEILGGSEKEQGGSLCTNWEGFPEYIVKQKMRCMM